MGQKELWLWFMLKSGRMKVWEIQENYENPKVFSENQSN